MHIEKILDLGLYLGRQAAEQTETQIDDELVDLLEAIRNDPFAREWFGARFDLHDRGLYLSEGEPSDETRLAFTAAGIPWGTLIARLPELLALAKQLKDLLASFKKKAA